MRISRIRQIIYEEISKLVAEADGDGKEKMNKEKEKIDQQKADFQQQKLDFNKQKLDFNKDKDYEQDQEKQEKEKENPEGEKPAEGEPEKKPNISFKDQGQFYEDAFPELRNFILSDGNVLDDEERRYISLVVQASQGRLDKGFENFLKNGKAGSVYGKDFSDKDIKKIIDYSKEHELVR